MTCMYCTYVLYVLYICIVCTVHMTCMYCTYDLYVLYICIVCTVHMYCMYVRLLQCPLEVGSGTLNLQGEYQTMLGQGGILQQHPTSGRVYIGITIVPDDFHTSRSICSTTLSADLLASFVTVEQRGDDEVAGRNITIQSFSRKNITLHVRPGRSGASLLMAGGGGQ